MWEYEDAEGNTQRRQGSGYYHSYRPPYRGGRGRGRANPHVAKALNNFGVTDLRQWLNKKHDEETQSQNPMLPPSDPSYNYLKDPLRDREYEKPSVRHQSRGPPNRSHSFRTRGYGRQGGQGRPINQEKPIIIKNPVNIKVEFTTQTGERNCTLDSNTKLSGFKQVSDRAESSRGRRPSRGRGGGNFRGRSRGRHNATYSKNEEHKTSETPAKTQKDSEIKEREGEKGKGNTDAKQLQKENEKVNEEQDEIWDEEQKDNLEDEEPKEDSCDGKEPNNVEGLNEDQKKDLIITSSLSDLGLDETKRTVRFQLEEKNMKKENLKEHQSLQEQPNQAEHLKKQKS